MTPDDPTWDTVATMRRQGATLSAISRALGVPISTVKRRVLRLEAEGRLTHEEAHAYGSRWALQRSHIADAGPPGPKLHAHLTLAEAKRLRLEVQRGGYTGYNEFLVELFRDYVAEKDNRRTET
jgi:hypothetical protein